MESTAELADQPTSISDSEQISNYADQLTQQSIGEALEQLSSYQDQEADQEAGELNA